MTTTSIAPVGLATEVFFTSDRDDTVQLWDDMGSAYGQNQPPSRQLMQRLFCFQAAKYECFACNTLTKLAKEARWANHIDWRFYDRLSVAVSMYWRVQPEKTRFRMGHLGLESVHWQEYECYQHLFNNLEAHTRDPWFQHSSNKMVGAEHWFNSQISSLRGDVDRIIRNAALVSGALLPSHHTPIALFDNDAKEESDEDDEEEKKNKIEIAADVEKETVKGVKRLVVATCLEMSDWQRRPCIRLVMAVLDTNDAAITDMCVLHGLGDNEKQKNWTPIVSGDDLFFIYMFSPFTLLHCDIATGMCSPVRVTVPIEPNRWRGSASPVFVGHTEAAKSLGISYLTVIHESNFPSYAHRFVAMDSCLTVTHASKLMTLLENQSQIEFCCGMALSPDGQSLLVTVGQHDNTAFILTLDLQHVLDLLYPYAFSTHQSKWSPPLLSPPLLSAPSSSSSSSSSFSSSSSSSSSSSVSSPKAQERQKVKKRQLLAKSELGYHSYNPCIRYDKETKLYELLVRTNNYKVDYKHKQGRNGDEYYIYATKDESITTVNHILRMTTDYRVTSDRVIKDMKMPYELKGHRAIKGLEDLRWTELTVPDSFSFSGNESHAYLMACKK